MKRISLQSSTKELSSYRATSLSRGFTLLELLIVITIISVLSVILIVALNPAETLRKARDTQRMSDMASVKTAIGIYVTTKTTPQLDGISGTVNDLCQATTGTWASGDKIWYSVSSISDTLVDGSTAAPVVTTAADLGNVDGTGWVKVNLGSITGGSPISNLPIDPINDIGFGGSDTATVTYEALVYRYACAADNVTFELNARLESVAFLTDDDRDGKDGGNDANYYEVGTALNIMGSGSDAH
ncbi:MAG: hypothetical protein A3B23_03430 [Candidatus Colwellbacteria bacterium RIFCSPLOWO2_01_FULL_48_10]|uniref:Type II secretion system protein GspG C-terminal domain-containing protein n=2 Tax=Bacteria candidate phyla TaxID=1783234 RepID=A0A1F5P204_9BACT|nr:MAG: hypothetical protein A2846_00800 [Candidatus Doudnabacteria bacterium RIFCSPHIGHO2_01_FULL_49_9]OGY59693.1 MAG: hypothetical protein A3B23_03430 [Candidatus Colwellbacteria bacterium RIFCSPLOWO2_01_FULL_48_10]